MRVVGLVGLGRMGSRICTRLESCGLSVRTWDKHRVLAGRAPSSSLAELAVECQCIFLALPTVEAVQEVVLAERGLLSMHQGGSLTIVDLSTNLPSVVRELSRMCSSHGVAFLDCPMSGGPWAAETGSLTLMVGGPAAALSNVRPILEHLATHVVHMGPSGTGATTKLLHNMVGELQVQSFAQAFSVGARLGIASDVLYSALSHGMASSRILTSLYEQGALRRRWDANVALDTAAKDQDLLLEMASQEGVELAFTADVRVRLRSLQEIGLGQCDVTSTLLSFEMENGAQVEPIAPSDDATPMSASLWRRVIGLPGAAWRRCLLEDRGVDVGAALPGDSWNAVFRGVGPQGAVFVKVHNEETARTPRSIRDIDSVANVVDEMSTAGAQGLVRVLRTGEGASASRHGGFVVSLFPWVEGTRPSRDARGMVESRLRDKAAGLLRMFHDAARGAGLSSIGLETRELPGAATFSSWSGRQEELWNRVRAALVKRGSTRRGMNLVDDLRAACDRFLDESPEKQKLALAEVVLHGDYTPENLVMSENGAISIVDFDLVHVGRSEIDVAYAALSFSGSRWFSPGVDGKEMREFVRSYEGSDRVLDFRVLRDALKYVILKAASLSFKEEQLESRMQLFQQVCTLLREGDGIVFD